jgi:hypothetical protein
MRLARSFLEAARMRWRLKPQTFEGGAEVKILIDRMAAMEIQGLPRRCPR